jgi:hypothetical protein
MRGGMVWRGRRQMISREEGEGMLYGTKRQCGWRGELDVGLGT